MSVSDKKVIPFCFQIFPLIHAILNFYILFSVSYSYYSYLESKNNHLFFMCETQSQFSIFLFSVDTLITDQAAGVDIEVKNKEIKEDSQKLKSREVIKSPAIYVEVKRTKELQV